MEAGADKLCGVIVSVVADFGIRLGKDNQKGRHFGGACKKAFFFSAYCGIFKAHSDFVVNNGSVNDTFQKTCEVIETIKERYNGG